MGAFPKLFLPLASILSNQNLRWGPATGILSLSQRLSTTLPENYRIGPEK